jgi:hypothetical protein
MEGILVATPAPPKVFIMTAPVQPSPGTGRLSSHARPQRSRDAREIQARADFTRAPRKEREQTELHGRELQLSPLPRGSLPAEIEFDVGNGEHGGRGSEFIMIQRTKLVEDKL